MEAQRGRKGRRGGLTGKSSSAEEWLWRHQHEDDGREVGQETNPLRQTISFRTWAICLPRWILASRTSFGWHLSRSFMAGWRRPSSPTATLPLPVPYPGCFDAGGGPRLSQKRLQKVAMQRALHVAVLLLNRLYLGRFASLAELERCPNVWQRKRLRQLRMFYVACGCNRDMFPLAPGRSGPELGASLYRLEKFVQENPHFAQGYHELSPFEFEEKPGLFPQDEFPELEPYKSLDVSRLRLVGQGEWPMEKYLDGVLWLPFQEPRFLAHPLEIDEENIPNFAAESREENLKLVKLWDARGLAKCFSSPLWPEHFSRVFNAHKNERFDRQIGDRRLPNLRERHLDGPSKFLPPGPLLCQMWLPRYTHTLVGSITDRRDFYHQAAVSSSRCRSNLLPFKFSASELTGVKAFEEFKKVSGGRKSKQREIIGDDLGPPADDGLSPADECYVGFSSLFQGDHLGVEFALASHERLLAESGLLRPEWRVQGHHPVPDSGRWEALVIDDYFCIGVEPNSCPKVDSFAFQALVQAREAYEKHSLEGSVEKDIVAERRFKAAGAEIDSTQQAVDLGLVTASSPLAKRIGLSTLSLRASRLPVISAKLASRLSGNWISVLLYRRCLASVVVDFFSLAALGEVEEKNVVKKLPRKAAEELVSLAALVPLISTNLAVPYSAVAYASDASLGSGAVVRGDLADKKVRSLWLTADKRGHYTKLDSGSSSLLRSLGEDPVDQDGEENHGQWTSPMKSPLLYFDFIEVCGGSGVLSRAALSLGLVVAPVLDLTYSPHYDFGDLRVLEWIMHMLSCQRILSFFVEPPCTTFSPAAFPAVRSYAEPLGFDRLNPKTWHGNLLAFRSFILMKYGKSLRVPCGLEQPRRSKMAWLSFWRVLLTRGFTEAIIASCQFGSIHQKEFRLLVYGLDSEELEVRCAGGHAHVPIQGKYTKPSATYVPDLALHIAKEFRRAIEKIKRADVEDKVIGQESILSNDVLASTSWTTVASCPWSRKSHINVLEGTMAVKVLELQSLFQPDCRFVGFLDSQVIRGAFAKGRSSSFSLKPLCQRAAAFQVVAGLYPSWCFAPTRLNPADDPTRGLPVRPPCRLSLLDFHDFGFLNVNPPLLRRPFSNWGRLSLLLLLTNFCPADASPSCSSCCPAVTTSCFYPLFGLSSDFWVQLALSALTALFLIGRISLVLVVLGVSLRFLSQSGTTRLRHVRLFMVLVGLSFAMEPQTTAERDRALHRAQTVLIPTRTVRPETRAGRDKLLQKFSFWLSQEHGVSLDILLAQKPADPEEICRWLVAFGQEMFLAGKTYGSYSETINAIGAARPLIRKQLAPAWDLAFAWLADEPHQHHPALPLSILMAMLSTCLMWGWATEAGVFALAWCGILRIGEVLLSKRKDLILPEDAAPGVHFILLRIRSPKTRGRAARHQAARVDPVDMIELISSVFGKLQPDQPLWPLSAATLRKRFSAVLKEIGLPEASHGSRGFDLGSFRPGGAAHLLLATEDPELCRRRGRWLSTRVMEIYLQEVMATTFAQKLDQDVRARIYELASVFPKVLALSMSFLATGIPCSVWPRLFTQAHDVK